MATTITKLTELVNELDSWRLTSRLTKEDGTALGSASMQTLVLTIYDVATSAIVNTCNRANILNVGRGTLDAAGALVVQLDSADNPILNAALAKEKHRLLIEGTWNAGKGRTSRVVEFTVVNVNKVP